VLSRGIARFDTERFWHAFADHITRYPRSYFVLSLTLLLGLALPVTQMRLWEPVQAIAPRNSESMAGYRLLEQDNWGGELIPVTLVVKAPPGQTIYAESSIAYLHALTTALRAQPAVADVQSLTSWQPNFSARDYQAFFNNWQTLGALLQPQQFAPLVNVDQGSTLALVQVFPKDLMALDDTQAILNFSRAYARSHPEQPLLTGGAVARVKDFTHELYRPLPLMLFLVLGGIYALLLAYMRTPVLPAKAAIMNFLPILSAFGLLTLVFQHGWLSGLLHTPINGAVTNIVPIVLFCIIFGLSMDYEVLILSRISERYEAHGQVRKAVVEGLSRSGSVITGAVLILLGVFVPGIFSSSPQTQEICLGISAAILLDATVVRLLLVPSFMMLLGKWNWWRPGKV
jgi:RND superfamily putative drug exporter